MTTPDYIICLECDTPVYTFDWDGSRVTSAICTACGNESLSQFMTEEDYEELASTDDRYYGPSDS
ncbi:MAG: hypothetical protein LJE93_03370 [Acidobacteria bacterium]|jgi:hypothetical protein|nr:hypothetical protein [Acidobacteriota bacterium]